MLPLIGSYQSRMSKIVMSVIVLLCLAATAQAQNCHSEEIIGYDMPEYHSGDSPGIEIVGYNVDYCAEMGDVYAVVGPGSSPGTPVSSFCIVFTDSWIWLQVTEPLAPGPYWVRKMNSMPEVNLGSFVVYP